MTLSMTYNGGYESHIYEAARPHWLSARGTFKVRRYWGGVPKEGTSMGVSDEVQVVIECRIPRSEMKDPPKPAGQPS